MPTSSRNRDCSKCLFTHTPHTQQMSLHRSTIASKRIKQFAVGPLLIITDVIGVCHGGYGTCFHARPATQPPASSRFTTVDAIKKPRLLPNNRTRGEKRYIKTQLEIDLELYTAVFLKPAGVSQPSSASINNELEIQNGFWGTRGRFLSLVDAVFLQSVDGMNCRLAGVFGYLTECFSGFTRGSVEDIDDFITQFDRLY